MTTKGVLILIEGLDLAGKSTACDNLVARLMPRPDHRRNALADKNPLYLAADHLRRAEALDGWHLGHAYLAAAALDMTLYRPPAQARIQESTIALRSYSHYRARGQSDLSDGFARILNDPAYPHFDAAVVLTASIESRRQRLKIRMREAPEEVAPDDIAVIRSPDQFLRMEEIMMAEVSKRYGGKVIDTSKLTKPEVVDAIIADLPTGIA